MGHSRRVEKETQRQKMKHRLLFRNKKGNLRKRRMTERLKQINGKFGKFRLEFGTNFWQEGWMGLRQSSVRREKAATVTVFAFWTSNIP